MKSSRCMHGCVSYGQAALVHPIIHGRLECYLLPESVVSWRLLLQIWKLHLMPIAEWKVWTSRHPHPPPPLAKNCQKEMEKDSRQKIIQKEKENEHVHIPFADSFIYKYKVGIIDPLFLGITSSNSELKYLLQKREANSQHKITSQSVTHN